MNFERNASSLALSQIVRTFLGLGLAVVLARGLSESDRGSLAVIAALAMFGEQLSQLGMRFAVIYRMSRPGVARARAVGAALWWTLLAFACVAGVTLLLSGWLRAHFLPGAEPALVYLALLLAGSDLFAGLSDAVARGIDRFDLRNANQVSIALGSLAAAAISLGVFHCELLGTLVATAVVRVVLMLLFGALTLRESGVDLSFQRNELAESLRFGLQGYFQVLLGKLHERADLLVMAALHFDTAQIAVYAVAVSVVDRLRVVPDSISAALLPKLVTLSPLEAGPYAARVTRQVLFWGALSAIALALAAPFLMPVIFGQPYAASVLPLIVLLPATVMLTIRAMPANYFIAVGRPAFNVWLQLASVTVNVAANLWAIPRFGIVGAAVASVLSYGVEVGASLLAFRSQTHVGLRETLVIQRAELVSYLGRARRLRQRLGGA